MGTVGVIYIDNFKIHFEEAFDQPVPSEPSAREPYLSGI